MVLPDLKNAAKEISFSAVDALAGLARDGSLLLSIVHRDSTGPVRLVAEVADFKPADTAELHMLTADVPWAANSLEATEAVKPVDSVMALRGGKLELELRPYSVARVRMAPQR